MMLDNLKVLNKKDLVRIVAEEVRITRNLCDEVLTAFLKTIKESLKEGKTVKIVGFGTFKIRKNSKRRVITPKGNEIVVPEKYVASWKPSKNLRRELSEIQIKQDKKSKK